MGGLLQTSVEQEGEALGGLEDEARFEGKQYMKREELRENERNAPLQLVAYLSGQATQGKVKDPTSKSYEGATSGGQQSADGSSTSSGSGSNSSANGMGSLFGWVGKQIIGGFLGQSGGGGSSMSGPSGGGGGDASAGASAGAASGAAASMGPPD